MNILTHLNGLLQSNGGSMAELNSYTLAQSSESIMLIVIAAPVIIMVGTVAY